MYISVPSSTSGALSSSNDNLKGKREERGLNQGTVSIRVQKKIDQRQDHSLTGFHYAGNQRSLPVANNKKLAIPSFRNNAATNWVVLTLEEHLLSGINQLHTFVQERRASRSNAVG